METFQRTQPHINVGTIGHRGHGKTTVTSAITTLLARKFGGTAKTCAQLDSAPEEKALGGTVDIAHVEYRTDKRHYAHVDCPGHAEFAKNMATGAAQMDGAILVCSASDDLGPQTREHILLARQMGVAFIIVYLNKADQVSDHQALAQTETRIRDLLTEYDFPGQNTPVIVGSARKALEGDTSEYGEPSIWKLMNAVDTYIIEPERDLDRPFLMPIEDTFSVPGAGTVATGRIERGTIKVGDQLDIVGLSATTLTTCNGVQTFRKSLDRGQVGDNVGILLRGVHRDNVLRGRVLAKPSTITPHTKFSAVVYILNREEGGRHTPFHTGYRPQFHLRTADVTGHVELGGGVERVMPGDNTDILVTLHAPIVLHEGLRFAMREGGRTVGVGVIATIQA